MKLEQIGFYTLSDNRAATASAVSRLSRCELVLTGRCNFKCPYCRRVGGADLPFMEAVATILQWADDDLYAIRFSGGEPLLYPRLRALVEVAKAAGIQRIAVSSNGSQPLRQYEDLLAAGVNDLSISLDACCAEDGEHMTGGVKGAWQTVVENIQALAAQTYLTVGIVLTEDNAPKINEIIRFAAGLGVADIRVIPAAQDGDRLKDIAVDQDILDRFPILRYRVENLRNGQRVRGLSETDSSRCGLVLDDMAVCGDKHYPCIIYMREGGDPIGTVGENMRMEREYWSRNHDTHLDPICRKNCLDVCVDYNNRFRVLNPCAACHG